MERVVLGLDLLVEQLLPRRRTFVAQSGNVVDGINGQAVAVRTIADSELKRRVNIALLPVSTDEQVLLAFAAVRQTVDNMRLGLGLNVGAGYDF